MLKEQLKGATIVRIVKNKDVPYTDYTSKLIDAKMKPVLEKLNEVFNVTHCRATTQQGEDDKEENDGDMPVNEEEVLEANLRNLY